MIAVDTNVVVRIIVRDDAEQADRAAQAMRDESVFVAKTVILETAWVLESCYELARESISAALDKLIHLRGATIEDLPCVERALFDYAAGADLADALHIHSAPAEATFVTFDRLLVRRFVGQARLMSPE